MYPHSSNSFRRLAHATLGLAVLAFVTVGCSTTAKVAQSSKGNVYLEEITDWSFEASHPAVIDQATMMKVIKGLYSEDGQNGTSRMSAGGSKPMRIFSDEDAEFLTPLLTQGLSKAKPEQLVGFRVSSSAGSGSEPTAGSIYVQNGSIHVTIAKGAHVTGFMPESVARTEQAPSYAAGGSIGATAMVIDYLALAKAPAPAALPVAKTVTKAPAPPTAASVAPASIPKMQPVATASSSAMSSSEVPSSEIAQLEKVKETIAKKESEINMLRKESDWMKRELRDRDEEIKALRASKISGKPAAKKKHAEAYQTR
jgi:hypothetical protein